MYPAPARTGYPESVFAGWNLLTPLGYLFLALDIVALGVEVWALADALRRPAGAFVAVGKQTKPIWLIILGVAVVMGLASAAYRLTPISFIPIIPFIAAAIYLTDVRPKVREFRGGSGGTRMGPYGPW